MKRKGLTLGGEHYASKEAAKKAIGALLAALPLDAPVDSATYAILRDLLSLHPEADVKAGVGVAAFVVRRDSRFGSRGFVVIRADGSAEAFSYRSCLEPWRHGSRADTTNALRAEIANQITDFRRRAARSSALVDAVTGQPVALDDVEIDHAPPWTFAALVNAWEESKGVAGKLEVWEPFAGSGELRLKDRGLAADWARFHADRAVLRVVSRETNRDLNRGAA